MIGALFILNFKGDIILQRVLRHDLPLSAINYFKVNIIHARGIVASLPINKYDKFHFMHVLLHDGIWLVAVTIQNVNCAMVFEFLNHLKKLFFAYVGTPNEDNIRNKYVVINELVEEMIDNGYPQITDVTSLKSCITQQTLKNANKLVEAVALTNQLTGQVTWRKPGLRYKKNEIFLDVVEKINLIMSSQGQILSTSVDGALVIKAYLSGMPECKCGINNKFILDSRPENFRSAGTTPKLTIALDDCVFHQCVKLNKYESEKSINFIPPDGKFELLKYRTTHDINLPFRVIPLVKELDKTHTEYRVALKSNFKPIFTGTKIEVIIPVPENTFRVEANVSKGRFKFRKAENCIAWRIKRMHGNKEAQMTATIEVGLPTNNISYGTASIDPSSSLAVVGGVDRSAIGLKKEARPPINLKFEVPFSCCGMKIKYLKVFESKLNYADSDIYKWIRYTAAQGEYEFRF